LESDADRALETVAGLILDEIGHSPKVRQRLEVQGWTVDHTVWMGGGSTSFWFNGLRVCNDLVFCIIVDGPEGHTLTRDETTFGGHLQQK